MAKIEIYTKFFCPYCTRAKTLLDSKGVTYEEFELSNDPAAFQVMLDRSHGARTVPQIFIDGQHIGGSDDLAALDARGGLDPLLGIG
ncbi:glutaredoxin 3 [Sphingopyxis yananensis]|uniref:glutaredoxin 3 n=1 Tax=Sphingopyxis yananensis TaxID=2886687 RepID=UPI001D0F5850|nr:glutaredoxin 3 [Sphingopyxis yananensis]MCC2602565.1 glutaredoxin 3 [Sphingopyxis yananensis]